MSFKNNETRENLGSRLIVSHKNLMLSDYMQDFKTRSVAVPVHITTSLFILDFKTILSEIYKGQEEMQEAKLRQLLSLLVKSYDTINDKDLVKELKNLGFSPDPKNKYDTDPLETIVADLRLRIGRSVSESGLTGLMVSNFFTSNDKSSDFKEFKDVNFANVSALVGKAQNFYAKFISKEKGDILGMDLHALMGGNAILSATRSLMRIFYQSTGSYVSCRESFVIDTIFKDVFGSNLIEKTPIIEGRFYRITNIDVPDIGFVDAAAAYIWSINLSMGISSGIDTSANLKISDILKELVTGIGVVMPFVPEEAGTVESKSIEAHYSKIYLLHLIRRITTDQVGEYYSRITQMVKANRFFKIDEYEQSFDEGLKVLSICYEAYRDTAFYYRDMFHRTDVFFRDYDTLHPDKRKKIVDFIDSLTDKLKNTNMSLEHPAYYKLPTHVITPMTSPFASVPMIPDWYVPRKQRDSLPRYILGDTAEATLSVGSSGLHPSANWWDILDKLNTTKIPFPLIRSCRRLEPVYFFAQPTDLGPLAGDVIKNMLSFFPVSKIKDIAKTEPQIADAILSQGSLMYIRDVYEMSQLLRVPLTIAQKMMEAGGSDEGFWVNLSDLDEAVYFMEPSVSQVYEEIPRDEPGRYIRPFIALFPTLVTYYNQAFNFMSAAHDIPGLDPMGGTLIKDKADPTTKKKTVDNDDNTGLGADSVIVDDIDPNIEDKNKKKKGESKKGGIADVTDSDL